MGRVLLNVSILTVAHQGRIIHENFAILINTFGCV